MTNLQFLISNFQLKISILSFCFLLIPFSALGYPIENNTEDDSPTAGFLDYSNLGLNQAGKVSKSVNGFVRSLLGPSISSFDLNKSFGRELLNEVSDGTGLGFDDLINTESFSSDDITGSIKAVVILFLKLIILTLSITLAIFKTILDLVLGWF